MENDRILVSVICTSYNHENFLRDTLNGFVMQKTEFAFEVLIHDDASTDNSSEIINEYAEKYPHIIKPIIQTENQYSKGVLIFDDILYPLAKGKYLAFCEGDDFWTDENKLQKQISFLENNSDYVACVHNSSVFDNLRQQMDKLVVSNDVEHDVKFEDVIFGMHNAYQTSSLVVLKEYFSDLPDFYYVATKYGFSDLPAAIWFTLQGKVKFLPYNMSTYRLMSNANSWSASNASKEKVLRNKEGIIAMLENVKKHVSVDKIEFIDKAINEQKFIILEILGQYNEMKKPPFDEIWNSLTTVYHIKILLKQYFPLLFSLLKNVKNKFRR